MKNLERTCPVVLKELQDHGHNINIVYDIGANDGRWYKDWKPILPSAQFVMFEANPNTQLKYGIGDDTLRFNQVLSHIDGATVEFFLANPGKESTGDSYYKELTPNYSANKSVLLKTKTLNTMIEENNLPLPDFIKMDTQGAEVDIMKGGSVALEHAKMALIEVPIMPYNMGAPNFNDYINAMYSYGFIPSGVHHIAMKCSVVNQMDIVFVKSDINQEIHNHRERYKGFV